jgi:hypothetical protein
MNALLHTPLIQLEATIKVFLAVSLFAGRIVQEAGAACVGSETEVA